MTINPSYEDLEQRVKFLEKKTAEFKKTDEALRESEEQFRDLVEGSIQGILIHRDHKPLFVNQAYAAIRGYTPEEILGMDSIVPMFSPQDQARLVEYKDDRLKGKEVPVDYEYQGVHKDGSLIWLESKVRVVQWEGRPAIQSTIFDISKRKQAEEALSRSEERYRMIFEAASRSGQGAVILQDRDNIEAACLFTNDAAVRILGYTREELFRISWFEILHSNCRDAARDRYITRLSGKDISGLFELTIIRKDGTEVPIELASIQIEFHGGGALVDFFRDISEQKKSKEMLKQANEALEQRVEDRTVELKISNEQLEIQKKNLEEVNTALRVLLKKRDEDKLNMEQKVVFNMNELILPYIEKLNSSNLDERQKVLLDILESNLGDITSSFSHSLFHTHTGFTPSEMQIANLIKQGKTSKQIAELLNLSSRTIETHRKNIRKKLGLGNKKINLRTHLLLIQ
ncbi:MAG TPA: PAS domain S-box protein [Deltaproteobacteria bacterium]|nr:PAS domain S-box protein [Deltaproteobacteria bacterium]